MSVKTYLKKVAVIAAAALTLGGMTAISANAAITAVTVTSPAAPTVSANISSGQSNTISLSIAGGNTDSDTFTFSGGSEVEWSVVATDSPGLSFSATTGNGGSFVVTKTNGSAQTFNLTVKITSATPISRTLSSAFIDTGNGAPTGNGQIFTWNVVSSTNGSVAITAPLTQFAAGTPTNLFVGQSVQIPGISYAFTATNTPATGLGTQGSSSHTISATVTGPAAPSAIAWSGLTATPGLPTAGAVTASAVDSGASVTTTVTGTTTPGSSLVNVGGTFSFTPVVSGNYVVTLTGAPVSTLVIAVAVANDTSRALWEKGSGVTPIAPSTVTLGAGTRSASTGNYSVTGLVTDILQYAVLTPTAGTPANAFKLADGVTNMNDNAGNYNLLAITSGNATFANATGGFANGTFNVGSTLGTATQLTFGKLADLTGKQVWVNAPTTGGTITLEWRGIRTNPVSLLSSNTLFQTITLSISAPGAVNEVKSTAVIAGVNPGSASGVVDDTEEGILAPMTLATAGGVTSGIGTAKAVITVSLKDVDGLPLVGKLPSVGASIEGPGTLSLSVNNGTANSDASTGRLLVVPSANAGTAGSPFAAGSSTFYINVFSDGTNGVAKVNVWVNGKIWKTKTVNFYGEVAKLAASSDRKVLKAGVTSPTTPCVLVATCDSSTVALTPGVQVLATDNKGVAVPYVSYTAVPDKTVVTGSAKTSSDVVADSIGATWFDVTTSPNAVSGNTGSVSYTTTLADGTTKVASNAVSFAIGGAPVAVTMGLASGASTEVGAKSSLVFTDKDAAGNAPYDLDVPLALKSNVALIVGTGAATAGNALPATIAMIGGKGTVTFYNPLVPGNVTISGLAAGLIAISTSFNVTNSVVTDAINAAADAAAEAIDAANAATDAANLAAEAADAATVAAEEARDAADAATAAIEELATQVAALIAALQAQIKTLANTVAKIAKKVKA
jgi:hypothetical protein